MKKELTLLEACGIISFAANESSKTSKNNSKKELKKLKKLLTKAEWL